MNKVFTFLLMAALSMSASWAQVVVFHETFDRINGTGGNDNKWEGSNIALEKNISNADNKNWSGAYLTGGKQCVKAGKSGERGYALTPYISFAPGQEYTLTFRAGAWKGDKKTLRLTVMPENRGTFSETEITLADATFTEYSITFTANADASSAMFCFSSKEDKKNRFFLDDVKLVLKETPTCSLKELIGERNTGYYRVTGEGLQSVTAIKDQFSNKYYAVIKDANGQSYEKVENNGYRSFSVNGMSKVEDYDQSNWLLAEIPEDEYVAFGTGSFAIKSLKGLYNGLQKDPIMTDVQIEKGNALPPYKPNQYCTVNFMTVYKTDFTGNAVESGSKASALATDTYFFMSPKGQEVADVIWAVWNADDAKFYVPAYTPKVNCADFVGGFEVAWNYNEGFSSKDQLVDGYLYDFKALVKKNVAITSAPKRIVPNTSMASWHYKVFPLNLSTDSNVTTDVNSVNDSKTVSSIRYYNVMGVEHDEPFDGVNVVVTSYSDGTSSVAKVVR